MNYYQAVNDLAWDHNGLVQRPSVVVFMENAEVRSPTHQYFTHDTH